MDTADLGPSHIEIRSRSQRDSTRTVARWVVTEWIALAWPLRGTQAAEVGVTTRELAAKVSDLIVTVGVECAHAIRPVVPCIQAFFKPGVRRARRALFPPAKWPAQPGRHGPCPGPHRIGPTR